MSTTSCFAPRVPDRVDQLGLLAKQYGLYHVVNNAYGIWCSKIAHLIKEAFKAECTVVVQSTDKNFMVPVGGSFVFCKDPTLLDKSNHRLKQSQPSIQAEPAAALSWICSLLSFPWGRKPFKNLKPVARIIFENYSKQERYLLKSMAADCLLLLLTLFQSPCIFWNPQKNHQLQN